MLPVVGHRVVQYMKPLDWARIVDALGYPSAGLGILIESAGVPFPGEALLLAAAAWAAARHHSLVLVIFFGFTGATAGADVGYLLGYRGGRPFVERFGHLLHIRPAHLARAELFFARHGGPSCPFADCVGSASGSGARCPAAMTPAPPPRSKTPSPPSTWAVPMLSASAAATRTGSADTPLMTM